jgi:hypothetical protein
MSEHEHYCDDPRPGHDHRWTCSGDPCTLPVAYHCERCRCGGRLDQVMAGDPLTVYCHLGWQVEKPHDALRIVVRRGGGGKSPQGASA